MRSAWPAGPVRCHDRDLAKARGHLAPNSRTARSICRNTSSRSTTFVFSARLATAGAVVAAAAECGTAYPLADRLPG
ncbi:MULTISPECIES: hypothetical protein [unclassified Streptomyces]|uniref:hypothetical protein n=1 Tax=unclassified Streptomyces TaxID=2593676 RepID=UPI00115F8F69|nr:MULTISPECIES: hypothetical protein [unclassified Streptomyces]